MSERQRRGGRAGGLAAERRFLCEVREAGARRDTTHGEEGLRRGRGYSRRRRRRGWKLTSSSVAEMGSERSQNAPGERGPAGEAG